MTEDLEKRWKAVSQEYFMRPDGTYIGDFEAMYRECEDPWLQSAEAAQSPFKRLILWRIAQLPERRVLDIGCGNGPYTDMIRREAEAEVLGIDVSPTAIANARARYPLCRFELASASEVARFADFSPTALCLCGLTWCILDSFREVLGEIGNHFPGSLLFHTLTFYGQGAQKHGQQYFTSLDELLPFLSGMTVQETFVHRTYPGDGSNNTLIVAKV